MKLSILTTDNTIPAPPGRLIVILLALALMTAACSKREQGPPPNTAATVNNRVITRQALQREIERVGSRFAGAAKDAREEKQFKKEILDILIGGELLYQASRDDGITVGADEVRAELAKVNASLPESQRSHPFTSEEIERKLAIEKFIASRFADTTVITDEQGENFYRENIDDFTRPENITVSHILIKCPPDADENTRQRALDKIKDIQQRLSEGADFAAMARQYSEDGSAPQGGSLGIVIRGQLSEALERAAFALEPGQTSDVVASEAGFHLIRVEAKEPTYVIPYSEIKDKLKAYLRQREINRKIDEFIKRQRASADIKTYV